MSGYDISRDLVFLKCHNYTTGPNRHLPVVRMKSNLNLTGKKIDAKKERTVCLIHAICANDSLDIFTCSYDGVVVHLNLTSMNNLLHIITTTTVTKNKLY